MCPRIFLWPKMYSFFILAFSDVLGFIFGTHIYSGTARTELSSSISDLNLLKSHWKRERETPPQQTSARIVQMHHTSQGIVVLTDSESSSFYIWTQIQYNPHSLKTVLIRRRVQLVYVSQILNQKDSCTRCRFCFVPSLQERGLNFVLLRIHLNHVSSETFRQ